MVNHPVDPTESQEAPPAASDAVERAPARTVDELANDYTEASVAVLLFLLRVGIVATIQVLQCILMLLKTVPNVGTRDASVDSENPVHGSRIASSLWYSAVTLAQQALPVDGITDALHGKWYAVVKGLDVGVYRYKEAKALTDKVSNAAFRGFPTEAKALEFFMGELRQGHVYRLAGDADVLVTEEAWTGE